MTLALLTTALLGAFQFQTPEGWTDLTKCADEATLSALPEDVANDARLMCGDRMDVFVVPHAGSTAMLTFIAPIAQYEEYQPVFAAVANDVVAASEGKVKPEGLTAPLKFLAFGSVCGGAAAGYYLLVVRRRKRKSV